MTSRRQQIPLEDLPELKSDAMEVLDALEESERHRLVQDAIRSLPPRDRLFMKLHFDRGLPLPEVAATMQISVRNAYIVKHRAIQKLKTTVASS